MQFDMRVTYKKGIQEVLTREEESRSVPSMSSAKSATPPFLRLRAPCISVGTFPGLSFFTIRTHCLLDDARTFFGVQSRMLRLPAGALPTEVLCRYLK